jgi:hypothetical protein
LWKTLTAELERKGPSTAPKGLDLAFVGEFVAELHAIDKSNERFRYPGKQLEVQRSYREKLDIDFGVLLFNLQLAHDVLDTLDTHLIETHGENEEWRQIQDGW